MNVGNWLWRRGGWVGFQSLPITFQLVYLLLWQIWPAGSQGIPAGLGVWRSRAEGWRVISSWAPKVGGRKRGGSSRLSCYRIGSETGYLGEESRRESEDLKLASCFPEVTQGFPDSACWSLDSKIMGLEERGLGGERSVWFSGDGGREEGDGTADGLLQARGIDWGGEEEAKIKSQSLLG